MLARKCKGEQWSSEPIYLCIFLSSKSDESEHCTDFKRFPGFVVRLGYGIGR